MVVDLSTVKGGAMERAMAGAAQGVITKASGSHAIMAAVMQSQVQTCPAVYTRTLVFKYLVTARYVMLST